jgi:hypothetical protein
LETDEDQETIRTSGRKEPGSHMDLELVQETGYLDKNQGVTWHHSQTFQKRAHYKNSTA